MDDIQGDLSALFDISLKVYEKEVILQFLHYLLKVMGYNNNVKFRRQWDANAAGNAISLSLNFKY